MTGLRIISHPVAGVFPRLAPREVQWQAELEAALLPSKAAARLRLPGALAVTTGQQPGLWGGPIYTIHKAVAAAALASELESRWQRPVVPIFWLAGDDHDWTEAAQTAWWSARDEVTTWRLTERAVGSPFQSLQHERLPAELVRVRAQLAHDLIDSPARDLALAWVDRHWRPGNTFQAAFASSIAELLDPLGIVCLDATHHALKRAQTPLIRIALEQAAALDAKLVADSPGAPSVAVGDGATLVFIEDASGRDRLMVSEGGFQSRRGGRHYPLPELLRLLEQSPQMFSANVLLRPVVEAALLPTVAYVAGPGELRYLSEQASLLYPMFGVSLQPPVPRWSGTVVDAVSDRLLGRLGQSAEAIIEDDGTLARSVLRGDLPEGAVRALSELQLAIESAAQQLTDVGVTINPVLPRAVEGRRRRLSLIQQDLQQLLERHLRRREDIGFAQYRRLRHRLRPLDQPQERVLGVAGALGRWGADWLPAASEAAQAWAVDRVETMSRLP
jgi:bacillithiol biosynthesis cysteine-adding enzyme BshC